MILIKLFTGKRVVAALVLYFAVLFTLPAEKAAFMDVFWSSPVYFVGLNVLQWYAVIGVIALFVRWLR